MESKFQQNLRKTLGRFRNDEGVAVGDATLKRDRLSARARKFWCASKFYLGPTGTLSIDTSHLQSLVAVSPDNPLLFHFL